MNALPSASATTAATSAAAAGQVLSFRLGAHERGFPILRVREIRAFQAPTPVAGLPPAVLGVHNLRGVIVPIVDLRALLGESACTVDAASRALIVLALRGQTVGAVVDAVCDVLELPGDSARDANPVQVLDIDRLFAGLDLFDAAGS